MKIVCVGYLHGAGGAERQIIMLANALAKRKHEVHLIVLVENNSKYSIEQSVIVHDLTAVEKRNGNRIVERFRALKSELTKIQPDVSIHYWLQSAYMCAMMKKSITGHVIYSERGDPGDAEYKGVLGIVRFLAFGRVDGFVFQSEGARDYFKGRVVKKSVVIRNSVEIPEGRFLEPCQNREKKIVNVGRLHPQKNQQLLINAFAKIANQFPEYILEIYGDGELKESLQEQIDQLGLHDRIYLKGTTKNILEKVYTASLFVLTSDYEGMPNALMEAMAVGVPCISTDCKPGGARELIENGKNGWIVPVNNVDALSDKIRNVLNTLSESGNIAKKAIEIRHTYSSYIVFNRWDRFLNTQKRKT